MFVPQAKALIIPIGILDTPAITLRGEWTFKGGSVGVLMEDPTSTKEMKIAN